MLFGDVPLRVWDLFFGFSNVRFFGHFQSMTLPLLVLPAMLWAMPRRYRVLLGVLNVFWWMLAIASGTRGTWLAMGVAFCVATLCRQAGRRWLKAEIGFLTGGVVCYLFFFDLLPWLLDWQSITLVAGRFADIASLSAREVIWKQAWGLIVAHPWIGAGPMHFAYYPNAVATHPHNALLQWAAEWGLPSAVLASVGVVKGLRALLQRISLEDPVPPRESSLLRVGLLCSLVAALTQSMVDGVIVMPYSQIVLAVIAGWALGLHLEEHPVISACPSNVARVSLIAVACFAAACMLAGVLPEVMNLQARENAFLLKHGGKFQPRFWVQGAIYK